MTRKLSGVLAVIAAAYALCGTARAVTFNTFTNPHPTMGPGTVGFAYAGNKFVGSVLQNGAGSLYSTDLNGANVQPFAPGVSLNSISGEHFVAASFGLGGFPNGDVYAADGSSIVHISNSGAASNVFITGLSGEVRGITFDLVGSFNNNMLVTTSYGNVYKVNSGGAATLLANVGEDVEGLDVAPFCYSFAGLNGQLIVASEGSGKLRAISPAGGSTDLTNGSLGPVTVASAEELTFVPLNLGASGSPLEGLYGANYTPDVLKAGYSEFLGMQGDIIVTSEAGLNAGQVSRVHWDSSLSQFVVTQVGSFPNQPEDGVFVTPKMVSLSVPEPSSLVLLALGVCGLLTLGWRNWRTE
jgi:hypothetical protein